MEPYFVSMAAARPTGWGPEVAPPKLSANVALAGMEVFVDLADLIDVGAEVERKSRTWSVWKGSSPRSARSSKTPTLSSVPPPPWCKENGPR